MGKTNQHKNPLLRPPNGNDSLVVLPLRLPAASLESPSATPRARGIPTREDWTSFRPPKAEDLEIVSATLEKRVGKDRYDTLTDELLQALDSSHKRKRQTRQSPFDPELGTIHCFQCTQRRDHRSPPGNNAVFAGYTATGKPVWSSLTNALLNSGDPRVDRLHGRGDRSLHTGGQVRKSSGSLPDLERTSSNTSLGRSLRDI